MKGPPKRATYRIAQPQTRPFRVPIRGSGLGRPPSAERNPTFAQSAMSGSPRDAAIPPEGRVRSRAAPKMGTTGAAKARVIAVTGGRVCANLCFCDESTDLAAVPSIGVQARVNQLRNITLGRFRPRRNNPTNRSVCGRRKPDSTHPQSFPQAGGRRETRRTA